MEVGLHRLLRQIAARADRQRGVNRVQRLDFFHSGERMIIGVPKEIKDHESRVGITPAGVRALTEAGHKVLVETHAGELSAFTDDDYQSAGAEIVGSARDVWAEIDVVVKVKEPVEKEYGFVREGLAIFTYLHLTPLPDLTEKMLSQKVTG